METMTKENCVACKELIPVYDPFDNSIVGEVKKSTKQDALKAIEIAQRGYEIIRKMSVHERATILFRTAEIVEKNKEEFAVTIAREGSKTIKEARKEANRCVNTLRVSAEESKRLLGETIPFDSFPGGENKLGYYYRQPIGVVLAITPFNDPLNLVAHKLGPAIAAGNSVVLKPATVTPLSAIKLAEAMFATGLPKECLQVVTGNGSEIGPALVQDERIRMVSFTGGFDAGKEITKIAGIKKIGMELGSNSPVIVWDDVDVDYAVESCVSGAFWAAGQNCIGVQRIYIHKRIYNEFRDKFVARTLKYKIGNKMQEDCDMGPMITEKEAERVEKWIKEAVSLGAKCLCGGKRKGAIMEPSVLENVPENATIHKEEVFGPAVNLYQVETMDEAIAKANSLPFGLHAAVFCNNINLAMKAAYGVDCGGVIINDSTDYRLDSMPFGGIKNSGLGREGIKFSLQEMTEPKMVCINMMN
ncbi:MAG TPA: aldehyde dehydrogenase family protein [Bacteroidales bacterium]|nr:aldehyde dehydrogenase family protein [Bacteroidales bacterium]HPS18158.1 aldehyde dehydrogenase family protein [Bacteroidales bacterium]